MDFSRDVLETDATETQSLTCIESFPNHTDFLFTFYL